MAIEPLGRGIGARGSAEVQGAQPIRRLPGDLESDARAQGVAEPVGALGPHRIQNPEGIVGERRQPVRLRRRPGGRSTP